MCKFQMITSEGMTSDFDFASVHQHLISEGRVCFLKETGEEVATVYRSTPAILVGDIVDYLVSANNLALEVESG